MDRRDKRQDKRSDHYDRHQDRRGKRGGFGTLGDLAKRPSREVRKQSPKIEDKTRCACGGHMKPRGPVGHAGHLRSKCRKCGATVWTRPPFKPPVPLVPTSKLELGWAKAQARQAPERARTRTDGDIGSGHVDGENK